MIFVFQTGAPRHPCSVSDVPQSNVDPLGLIVETEVSIELSEPTIAIMDIETHTPLELSEILWAMGEGYW